MTSTILVRYLLLKSSSLLHKNSSFCAPSIPHQITFLLCPVEPLKQLNFPRQLKWTVFTIVSSASSFLFIPIWPCTQIIFIEFSTESLIIATSIHNPTQCDFMLALRIAFIAAWSFTRKLMDLLFSTGAHLAPYVIPTISAWTTQLYTFNLKLSSRYGLLQKKPAPVPVSPFSEYIDFRVGTVDFSSKYSLLSFLCLTSNVSLFADQSMSFMTRSTIISCPQWRWVQLQWPRTLSRLT